jgi:surface polysaccharide O-acyltransferase-like enzyme
MIASFITNTVLICSINSLNQRFSFTIYEYLSLPIVLATISVYSLIRYCIRAHEEQITTKTKNAFVQLARASFGIYLIHLIIIELLYNGSLGFIIGGNSFNPSLAIPFTTIIVFSTSALINIIILHIPGLKLLIGA